MRLVLAWLVGGALTVVILAAVTDPLPRSVPTALTPAPVRYVDSLPDGALARVNFYTRLIEVRRDLSPEGTLQALSHETCHLALFDASITLEEDVEERVCDAWGNQRVRELAAPR